MKKKKRWGRVEKPLFENFPRELSNDKRQLARSVTKDGIVDRKIAALQT